MTHQLLHLALLLFLLVQYSSAHLDPVTGRKMGAQSLPPWPEQLLYVDRDLLVFNKPPNMLSVPGVYAKDSLATRVADTFRLPRISEDKP